MATTYAPRSLMDEGAIEEMNDATTRLLASTLPQDAMAGSMNHQPPHINLPPPPNPPFTFPAHPSSSTTSSLSRTVSRRHQSAIDIPKIGLDVEHKDSRRPSDAFLDFRFNPAYSLGPENSSHQSKPFLPNFSFKPAETPASDSCLLSPSFTPPSPRTNPNSNHLGHRRGGSEFVGGKLKSGERITVMNISPIKSESSFGPPLFPSGGPNNHQRGHSHRRSSAISSHDLSLILQGPGSNSTMGSSASTGPAGVHGQHVPVVKNEKLVEATATSVNGIAIGKGKEPQFPEKPSQSSPELSPKPPTRARVGFSDTLEFIPRPLSLISTDTASTVRPGHSVSGSMSSITSATNSTNLDRDSRAVLTSPISHTRSNSRPSTAGAVLERTSSIHVAAEDGSLPKRRNSIPILNEIAQGDLPTSTVSTPSKPKRWSFFGLDSFAMSGPPTEAELASSASSETNQRSWTNIVASPSDDVKRQDSGINQGSVAHGKKRDKKRKKKVKLWADSLLTRKSKSRTQKSKARHRSQTPPAPRLTENEGMDYMFSGDANRSSETAFESKSLEPILPSSGTSKHHRTSVEDEMPYPMIDLDAALGPFNTPTRDPQWDEAQRPGVPPKRQLHSAAGMRGFSGPGMHYHRRTESAPEMPPFNVRRFSTSLAMADVFEEDEEYDDGDQTGESATEDSTSESQDTNTGDEDERDLSDAASTPTQDHRIEMMNLTAEIPMPPSMKGDESVSNSDLSDSGMLQNDHRSQSRCNGIIAEEQASFLTAREETMFTTPLGPFDYAASSNHRDSNQTEPKPPDATSIMLSGSTAMPNSPYPTSHPSSIPTPHSPSCDAHRISTAASSTTDVNNFESLLMGEPGPEVVRLSFEVPSLTSTNSVATRENSFAPGCPPSNFYEQRPASYTSPVFGRRRSSLVSLSRLISSAHGERSKLSMEVPCDSEEDKKSRPSRSKRLTRLMRFWKPKAP
ncbi:hypothetical protein GGS21DRAFT_527173 [Xylaria nigripes]|nr:hypothetical protein GGS21DRAFT_527173 [Xylaria nigripes]